MKTKHALKLQSGIFFLLLVLATTHAKAQSVPTVYTFSNSNGDGTNPYAGLTMDSSRNLYGTTLAGGAHGSGTVFELVNNNGTYTERILYSFTGLNGDSAGPYAGLTMDSSGNLYGTTAHGGGSSNCSDGCGTVFELVKNSGAYAEKVLYGFTGLNGDGEFPVAAVIMDAAGSLYGTTYGGGTSSNCPGGCGTVFELVNNSGTYTETVIHSFTGYDGALPWAALVMDSVGNLYGTTWLGGTGGTVFELVKDNGTYTAKVLHSFTGPANGDGLNSKASLIMDASGNLYGTTQSGASSSSCLNANCGVVLELVKNSGTYTEQVLHSFTGSDGLGPNAGLVMDSVGNFYGTTQGGGPNGFGTVFELVNNAGTYTEQVLHGFTNLNGDGQYPLYANLIMDSSGNLYGTTMNGGVYGVGTVFEVTPPSSSSNSPGLSANNTFSGSNIFTQTITGNISGSAGSVTNGLYTTGSYADPSWITSLSGSKIFGSVASADTAGMASVAGIAGALGTTPTQCSPNSFSTGIAATGNANCAQPASANLSDSGNLVLNTQGNIFQGGKQTFPASTQTYASLNLPNNGMTPTGPIKGDLWLTPADTHPMFQDSTNITQRLAFLADVTSGNLLPANNSFTGNNTFSQIISGSITGNAGSVTNGVYSTNFYADPNWITALSGSKITGPVGSAAYASTAGTALTAGSAGNATTAANATSLGGTNAGSYARLDVGNALTGNQNVTGNLNVTGTVTIGASGTPITEHLSLLVNARFPALHPISCATSTFAVPGAADGDTIALGVPNALMSLGGIPMYTAWVSASNTVTIQSCNLHLLRQIAAANGSIRIDLWKH